MKSVRYSRRRGLNLPFFFELLDEGFDCSLAKRFTLPSLPAPKVNINIKKIPLHKHYNRLVKVFTLFSMPLQEYRSLLFSYFQFQFHFQWFLIPSIFSPAKTTVLAPKIKDKGSTKFNFILFSQFSVIDTYQQILDMSNSIRKFYSCRQDIRADSYWSIQLCVCVLHTVHTPSELLNLVLVQVSWFEKREVAVLPKTSWFRQTGTKTK